jgi:hypothetical protein
MKFTPAEIAVMCDQDFFLRKDSVTGKLLEVFGEIESELRSELTGFKTITKDFNFSNGKIFRGENYKRFPYIVLDYPRIFSADSVFAFRTMFWWGHEFSFTLHLQGKALDKFREAIKKGLDSLKNKQVYFCVNDTPWQYHFEKENYWLIEEVQELENKVADAKFIKLSKKIPVESFNILYNSSIDTFKVFLEILNQQQ